MAFNYPQTDNSTSITIPPNVQYAIGVDGINTKVLPAGSTPTVIYRIGDGTVHPEGWENIDGNKYLDFYVSSGATGATGPRGERGIQGIQGNQGTQGIQGEQGITGPQGKQGVQGPKGVSVTDVSLTGGDGTPGTIDTYTITLSDTNTFDFEVYNGSDGAGGDMFKSTYDSTNNGVVDNSENLEGNNSDYHLARDNHTGTQTASTISDFDNEVENNTVVTANTAARHTHTNKSILDNINQELTTSSDVEFGSVQLAGGSGSEGKMSWNADEATIDIIQNGATLQVGQETQMHCRNTSGSTIANGTVVMATGTLGASGRVLISPYDGTSPAKFIIGVTTEDILNGEDGKATNFGKVRGIDTSSYSEGDVLYTATNGGLTSTMPSTGIINSIAFVINVHAVNGTILVRLTPVNENIDEELGNLITEVLN